MLRYSRTSKDSAGRWGTLMITDDRLLKPTEVAQLLSVSRSEAYRLISEGRIRNVQIDEGRGQLRVRMSALKEFMENLGSRPIKPDPAPEGYIGYAEIAERLGTSPRVAMDRLRYHRLDRYRHNSRTVFLLSDFENLLADHPNWVNGRVPSRHW